MLQQPTQQQPTAAAHTSSLPTNLLQNLSQGKQFDIADCGLFTLADCCNPAPGHMGGTNAWKDIDLNVRRKNKTTSSR